MFVKLDNKLFLSGSLSVSAGVLIYVSLMDVMSEAKNAFALVEWIGAGYGPVLASTIYFFVGMAVVALDLLTTSIAT
jgi:ZIP family zinc transporter